MELDTKLKVFGVVERQLYDKNGKVKNIFQENSLWKLLKDALNVDIRIPFVTGLWVNKSVSHNLVTTKGKEIIAKQLNGVTTAPVTAIAIGTGTTSPVAGNTALETESTTNGGARGAATASNATVTTTGDTAQWVKTFTFTGSIAVTEEGLLDNNTSGGNMLARNTFAAINVVNGDSLQITHKIQLT
jgi:hypothetical protein